MAIFYNAVGGGGGISSDELNSKLTDVRKNKTAVTSDSNDGIGVGSMPEYSGINTNGLASMDGTNVKVKPSVSGYYDTGSGLLVPQGTVASVGGLTASKMMQGQSAFGVSGTATNDGTASASQILRNVVAYSKGSKLIGTIDSMAGTTINPTNATQTVASSGKYMTSNIIINPVSNLIASNIKKGVKVGNIVGTFQGMVDAPLYLFNNGVYANRLQHFIKKSNGAISTITTYGSFKCITMEVYSNYSGSDNDTGYNTSNPTIDLTNFNFLYVLVGLKNSSYSYKECTMSVGTDINISPRKDTVKVSAKVQPLDGSNNATGTTLKLDISKLSGYHYIKFGKSELTDTIFSPEINIKQLWLDNV